MRPNLDEGQLLLLTKKHLIFVSRFVVPPVCFKAWWRIISNKTLDSQVGMSPIGSYVGGLTSKGQVGMLLGEHRGWILRMAALIKGRLSDNRPEAFAASFQTSEGEHQHAFLFPNIQHSTFHHSLKRMVPLSLQRGKRAAWFPFGEELAFSRFSTFSSSVCFPLL